MALAGSTQVPFHVTVRAMAGAMWPVLARARDRPSVLVQDTGGSGCAMARPDAVVAIENPAGRGEPVDPPTTGWPIGFWWAELTHPYWAFTEAGYDLD